MKFTLKTDLPIKDLTSEELNECAKLGIKKIHSTLTEEENLRLISLQKTHFDFDLYEYNNFDFMFFLELIKKNHGHLKTIVFYGNVESNDFTRNDYNNWNHKTWFDNNAYEGWQAAIQPIIRQAWDFMKIKDKYIFDPYRGNMKARNTTWTKTLSVLPTLNPDINL